MSDMAIIQALDPSAHLSYSKWTQKWYVVALIEIGDGSILEGICEHRDLERDAVAAFADRLTTLEPDQYLVTYYGGWRREWTWNGAAFAECTRASVIERQVSDFYKDRQAGVA